jgi:hypothetical protein
MAGRPELSSFSAEGMTLDDGSSRSIAEAMPGNMFTGIMDLRSKIIYFGPLAPAAVNSHYPTIVPNYSCFAAGRVVAPIVHDNSKQTSHSQFAHHAIGQLGNGTEDDFCGFALRFEENLQVALAPTSRSLNPGENGTLESIVLDALYFYLKVRLFPKVLYKATARTSMAAKQASLGLGVRPAGFMQGIQNFAFKPKRPPNA